MNRKIKQRQNFALHRAAKIKKADTSNCWKRIWRKRIYDILLIDMT